MICSQRVRLIYIITLFLSIYAYTSLEPLWAQTIYAGGEKQQVTRLTVSSQGMINVPFIGPVKAKGLTIPQLEMFVTKPLAADYFVNPEINIVINEYHSLQYYISGAVGSPGLYEMRAHCQGRRCIFKPR
jgi:protein involved in polysaccharide export with SLBB domain